MPGSSSLSKCPVSLPVRSPAGFHFGDYGVNQDLARIICSFVPHVITIAALASASAAIFRRESV